MPVPVLLTRKEAAARTRRSLTTFNDLLREGQGPAVTRIGRRLLIREDSLIAWLDAATSKVPTAVDLVIDIPG